MSPTHPSIDPTDPTDPTPRMVNTVKVGDLDIELNDAPVATKQEDFVMFTKESRAALSEGRKAGTVFSKSSSLQLLFFFQNLPLPPASAHKPTNKVFLQHSPKDRSEVSVCVAALCK